MSPMQAHLDDRVLVSQGVELIVEHRLADDKPDVVRGMSREMDNLA